MARAQFTFYRSFWDAAQYLPPEDRLSLLDGVAAYALDGKQRELTDSARALFILIKPTLDASAKKSVGGTTGKPSEKTAQRSRKDTDKTTERYRKDIGKIPERSSEDTGKEKEGEKEDEVEKEEEEEEEKKKENENECSFRTGGPSELPPAIWEVAEYASSVGAEIDTERFVDYYDALDWHIDGRPVHDWRKLLLRWAGLDRENERRNDA